MSTATPDQDAQTRDETVSVAPVEAPSENYTVVAHLNRMPAVFSRGLIYVVFLAAVAAVVFATLVRIDASVRCSGVVASRVDRVTVQAPAAATLRRALVSAWDVVEAGRPLYILAAEDGDPAGGESEVLVRAPIAGTLAESFVPGPGAPVGEGAALCTIIPVDASLYMDISVEDASVGRLKPGLRVVYRINAFSSLDFGTVSGTVERVAPFATLDQYARRVFRVQGSLDRSSLSGSDGTYPIREGMTADVRIITGRRSILSLLLGR